MFKIIQGIIIFIVSLFVFYFLEFESSLAKVESLIQPLFFAATLSICIIRPHFRKIILIASAILLAVMIFTYLFNQLNIANWVGSLGFGILIVTIASYIPELVKKGYIERY